MTSILLDTTALVDHLRNIKPLKPLTAPPIFSISVITALELIQGCHNKSELKTVKQLLRSLPTLPITPDISFTTQLLLEEFCLSHGLRILDALIAATAITHRLTLVTANIKHFAFLPNLKLKS